MIRVAIIEDEKYAAAFLEELLQTVAPDAEVVASLASIEEAVRMLPVLQPSLVLADIQLEDGLSFSIFEQLQWAGPVIFITAYDAYAIRAFKANGIDYILKPCSEADLAAAFDRFRRQQAVASSQLLTMLQQLKATDKAYRERFAVQLGVRLLSVPVADVAYFEFERRVTYLVSFEGQRFPISDSLDSLVVDLDPKRFFRINRSMLIAHKAIQRIEMHAGRQISVQLQPAYAQGMAVVSKDRITEFKAWLNS